MNHSTPQFLLLSVALLIGLSGCRQKDFREMTIELPGLAPLAEKPALMSEAEKQIRHAFTTYEKHVDPTTGDVTQENAMSGIELDSVKLSASDGTIRLSVRFDSVQAAEMNVIRMLDTMTINGIVLTEGQAATNLTTGVAYPILTKDAPAGYINARKTEAD